MSVSERVTYHSILFRDRNAAGGAADPPPFFHDLNLDQIVDGITIGKEEYDLKPFFYAPLHEPDAILYRQEVMRELADPTLLGHLTSFVQRMRALRAHLTQAQKLHYPYQQQRWFLEAVIAYGEAVEALAEDLGRAPMRARALMAFREYVTAYARSEAFMTLQAEARRIEAELSTIHYCVRIHGDGFTVRRYADEADYSAEVTSTFEKFSRGAAKDYLVKFSERPEMNHIEAQVLEFVARLYPEIFAQLGDYRERYAQFQDETVTTFDREIQFFLSYLEYLEPLKRAGLTFCYPLVSASKEVFDREAFDLALGRKLVAEGSPVVCNDFSLRGSERIVVVSGPNNGGKTTFARMFGQVHYLAALGLPVPGKEAQLHSFDTIFTHFETEEDLANLRGKLEDDLFRIHEILRRATSNSLIIVNEIFTSTTLGDAILLGTRIVEQIVELDALSVYVTFVDQLASLSAKTVSMVSTVVPEEPAVRTFKIVRKAADGLAFAISIAQKHGVTYERLKERIES